jgi:3-phosphoshikimate 1-carboxyvinyltransferase
LGEVKTTDIRTSIAASKSLLNRALIVKSFFPQLQLVGDSQARDVLDLKVALQRLETGRSPLDCGEGGTTLRFLLARASRRPGDYVFTGRDRLLRRPHTPLLSALDHLGVAVQATAHEIHLHSSGWQWDHPLSLSLAVSSQFVSALLLSAWQLPKTLVIDLQDLSGSRSYLQMTVDFLRKLGMAIEWEGQRISVPANELLQVKSCQIEPDMSSAFAVAAVGLVSGRTRLLNFPRHSVQPDFQFIQLLQQLGGQVEYEGGDLIVHKSQLRGADLDLQSTPDLFPVLAVLLARAQGPSRIRGLGVLPYKESNRIEKSLELLRGLNCEVSWDGCSFQISGGVERPGPSLLFDPDQDHRMAMAAGVARAMGVDITLQNPDVVAKSFPNFWEVIG